MLVCLFVFVCLLVHCFQLSLVGCPGPYTLTSLEFLKNRKHVFRFHDFFPSLLTWDPMGTVLLEQIFQNTTPPANCLWYFQTSPEFSYQCSIQTYGFIYLFFFFLISMFFPRNITFILVPCRETANVSKRSHREIWASVVSIQCILLTVKS